MGRRKFKKERLDAKNQKQDKVVKLNHNLDGADSRFTRMVNYIVARVRIEYAKPEQKIVKQGDGPQERKYDDGDIIEGYFMVVILRGTFRAETRNAPKGA